MKLKEIEKLIAKIPTSLKDEYITYWKSITPASDKEYHRRFEFSHLSVHCGWQANVKAYQSIKRSRIPDKRTLRNLISYSGVGLVKMRTDGMWKFRKDFYNNSIQYIKQPDESWIDFRDRLVTQIHGLGNAKASFAIELCYPNEAEVCCLDVHMLRLYGHKDKNKTSNSTYKYYEDHWVKTCKKYKIPPFIARCIWWDQNQNEKNSRYWSHVFESKPITTIVKN